MGKFTTQIAKIGLLCIVTMAMASCATGKRQQAETNDRLNEAQHAYLTWTETKFREYLDPNKYSDLPKSEKRQLEAKWLSMLRQPESREYVEAINGLTAIKSRKAIKPLLRIATERREKDNRNRWMAVRGLGIIGDKAVVPELIPLVYHYNQNTRMWAQISLVRLTDENFGTDWQAWGKWWNQHGGRPKFSGEYVQWTTNKEWADPNVQQAKDAEFFAHPKLNSWDARNWNWNVKLEQIDTNTATLKDVIRVFGEPQEYLWGKQRFDKNDLPETYIAKYPTNLRWYFQATRLWNCGMRAETAIFMIAESA